VIQTLATSGSNESLDERIGVSRALHLVMRVGGQTRKVMIQANKNGFLYVLDRTSCKLMAARPYVKVNWATRSVTSSRSIR
jgi:glucose dehydrogenase